MENKPDHTFLIGGLIAVAFYFMFKNPVKTILIVVGLYVFGMIAD